MPSSVKKNLVSPNRRKGRPPWRPDLMVVERLAQPGVTFDQIAVLLGINRATLFRKKQESEEFCDAIRRGRAKGLLAVSNALYEQVKANNVSATIRLLKKLGWNKRDSRSCPDPWYVAEINQKKWRRRFRSLIRFMTLEERNRYVELNVRVAERKKAAGRGGHTDVGDRRENLKERDNSDRFGSKPPRRRTGRPRWLPPQLSVVTGLAERGLTLDDIALCLEINRATLFRRIRSDEDFAQAIATGRARALAFVSGKLFEQARKGKLRALIFYLRTVHGWGENRPEHEHGPGCILAEERERGMAESRLLTIAERKAYLDIVNKAEERMKAAGARVPDDGLDEWGNVKARSSF